jgi:hypothetical protein
MLKKNQNNGAHIKWGRNGITRKHISQSPVHLLEERPLGFLATALWRKTG